jgi:hypothetical protein
MQDTTPTQIGEDDSWFIEGADPEVGIFGDTIIHECPTNVETDDEDIREATQDVNMRTSADGRMVDCVTTFTCPVCKATTEMVESWPVEMFTEPGRE